MGFRENQASLVLLGIVATRGHQEYLVSMVYLGLLGRKVERCEHIFLTQESLLAGMQHYQSLFDLMCVLFLRVIQAYQELLERMVLRE